jgi:hypothetical protein
MGHCEALPHKLYLLSNLGLVEYANGFNGQLDLNTNQYSCICPDLSISDAMFSELVTNSLRVHCYFPS